MRILIFVAVVANLAIAQNGAPTKVPVKSAVPRASNGKPDLTGVWQPGTTRRGTWEEANSGNGLGGTGTDASAPVLPSSTARQTVEGAPYQPWAVQRVLESYKIRAIDDPAARCVPGGVPRINTQGLFPMKIVQTPREIVMLYEYTNVFRTIPIDGKHPDDLEPSYLGDAVGRWEGDSLVNDIIGFNEKTWLAGAGTFHTESLHITERFTRINQDRIDYEAKMEDPNVFTKPWILHNSLMLRVGTRLREYICPENEQDLATYEKLIKEGTDFKRH